MSIYFPSIILSRFKNIQKTFSYCEGIINVLKLREFTVSMMSVKRGKILRFGRALLTPLNVDGDENQKADKFSFQKIFKTKHSKATYSVRG
ncbi:hypothetical protein OnM2_039046 [Erysiphe neolycopersici]|uniref:Uncharacterized protein n=1 Tax=Erysiphe neolycopersici TaxID=212602 RepID=A0A420HW93_9PEZI|nr:hypothetical protein OnM2_039046 [Erysiphe neolycopersici]